MYTVRSIARVVKSLGCVLIKILRERSQPSLRVCISDVGRKGPIGPIERYYDLTDSANNVKETETTDCI